MERIFGLIQVQPSVVLTGDGIGGLAVLTALNPFLSLLPFVMVCSGFAVLWCPSVGQDPGAGGCVKGSFKPAKDLNRARLHLRTRYLMSNQ